MRVSRLLLGVGMAVTGAVGTGVTSAAPASAAAPRVGCPPSQPAYEVSSYSYPFYGAGSYARAENINVPTMTTSLSETTNSQVTYSLSVSAGVDAGIIFDSVSLTVTAGISYSHTDSESKTATITIPEHHFGFLQIGNTYVDAHGAYIWRNEECKIFSDPITAYFPVDDTTFAGGINTTPFPPWPQAWQ
jgi:hypothetical protein